MKHCQDEVEIARLNSSAMVWHHIGNSQTSIILFCNFYYNGNLFLTNEKEDDSLSSQISDFKIANVFIKGAYA